MEMRAVTAYHSGSAGEGVCSQQVSRQKCHVLPGPSKAQLCLFFTFCTLVLYIRAWFLFHNPLESAHILPTVTSGT